MRRLLLSLTVLALTAPAAYAANENPTGFTAIDAQGQYRVEVTMGDHYGVTVDGPDAAGVGIHSDGATLQLRQIAKNGWGGPHRLNATVHVTTPALTALTSSRGMELWANGLRANQFDVHASMGTELHLGGTCGALTVNASMGAEIDASGLDCASAQIEASMGAEVRVHAHDSATAHASMGGEVRVSGRPPRQEHSAGLGGEVSFE